MTKSKTKKIKAQISAKERIDPDHFTVFDLKEGWEAEAFKCNSQETIKAF